jgi:FkbM family methyltransferase
MELKRILKRPRHQPFSVKLAGHPFQAIDSLSFFWGYHEIFEQRIYRFPNSPNPPRILDCGANVGLASLFFLRTYPGCHLTALEPDPEIFKVLENNLRPHKNSETSLLNLALTGRPGTHDFYQHQGDSGRLGHSLQTSASSIKVKGIFLDELLADPVDFLKIDIEGAEGEVLAATRYLRHARFVFIEYHSFQNHLQELDAILGCLSREGFRYWIQNHFTPRDFWAFAETIEGMDAQINIFARRESV